MKYYIVILKFQFPAWDEKDGIPFDVFASSKSEAIAAARRKARDYGHLGGQKGRVSFKATEANETMDFGSGEPASWNW